MLKKLLNRLLRRSLDFREHRRVLRFACDFPVEVDCHGYRVQGRALEISLDGLRIRCYGAVKAGVLKPGRTLRIRNLDALHEHLQAYVASRLKWIQFRRGMIVLGTEFERADVESSWVVTALHRMRARHVKQKRTSFRIPCQLPVSYLLRGRQPAAGALIDLSLGGACLESAAEIPAQQPVAIQSEPLKSLPPLRLVGTVVRRHRVLGVTQHGLDFGELLTPPQEKVLHQYLQRLAPGQGP